MRNPPAFDKFLLKYQEQLVKVVPPEWLPEPIFVATKAAEEITRQMKRLVMAEEHAEKFSEPPEYLQRVKDDVRDIIKLMSKQRQQRKGFKEYGAGHYGVVYPTQKPGIVCKITTDASEAQTVANMMTWDQIPYGMVKYYAIFQFSGSSLKRRPVYILWRDEMQPISLSNFMGQIKSSWEEEMLALLHETKNIAHQTRLWIQAAMKREWKKSASFKQVWADISWARDNEPGEMTFNIEQDDSYRWLRSMGRLPFRSRMAQVLYALRLGWRDLMSWSYGFHPGHALFTCLENDMLLADVHADNVMKAQDGSWDVSDPGHMIELSDRYTHVKIPSL
jgi:hypothetical protein